MALAINNTIQPLKDKNLTLEAFTYTNKGVADELYKAMNATEFLGISVSLIFSTISTLFKKFGDNPALTSQFHIQLKLN